MLFYWWAMSKDIDNLPDRLVDVRLNERQGEVLKHLPECGWSLVDACNAASYALRLDVDIDPDQIIRTKGFQRALGYLKRAAERDLKMSFEEWVGRLISWSDDESKPDNFRLESHKEVGKGMGYYAPVTGRLDVRHTGVQEVSPDDRIAVLRDQISMLESQKTAGTGIAGDSE
jgi:hypothetical protein